MLWVGFTWDANWRMNEIKLIVGLGNPGHKYDSTRHNAGFWWVDAFARTHSFTFREESRFHGLLACGRAHDRELLLLKPQTFMNVSGRALSALTQFYKIDPRHVLVVHDELDLLPGSVKLKLGGGHGGHNGLKDIFACLGTRDFWRMRMGIGHPGDRADVVDYVLSSPPREEVELIERAVQRSLDATHMIVNGEMEAAMLGLHKN